MGAGSSSEAAQETGYHVLTVQRASPAEEAGIEPYFDYLCAINSIRLDKEDNTLMDQLKANLNQEVTLTVYSSKTLEFRETIIVPSNNWGGVGLLGARVRFCNFSDANENVWHILDVYPNSPAARAGLQPHVDYVISSPESLLHDQNAFAEVVQQSLNKPLRLYVYNVQKDSLREVTITPDKNWGGAGSLGCDVGYGFLHRIPQQPENRTPRKPSDRALVGRQAPVPSAVLPLQEADHTSSPLTVQNEVPQPDAVFAPQASPSAMPGETDGFAQVQLVASPVDPGTVAQPKTPAATDAAVTDA